MTYVCPIWEHAADARLLKLHRMVSNVCRITRNLDRCTPVRELHAHFKIPYVYDYITKLRMTQAELILNLISRNVRHIGQGKSCIGSIRGLNSAPAMPTTVQLTDCSFRVVA
jgi:hypothetical protein